MPALRAAAFGPRGWPGQRFHWNTSATPTPNARAMRDAIAGAARQQQRNQRLVGRARPAALCLASEQEPAGNARPTRGRIQTTRLARSALPLEHVLHAHPERTRHVGRHRWSCTTTATRPATRRAGTARRSMSRLGTRAGGQCPPYARPHIDIRQNEQDVERQHGQRDQHDVTQGFRDMLSTQVNMTQTKSIRNARLTNRPS